MRRRSDKKDQIKGGDQLHMGAVWAAGLRRLFRTAYRKWILAANQASGCQKKDGEKEGEIENEGMEHLGDTSAQLPRAGDHFLDGIEGLPSKSYPTRSRPAGKSIKKLL
jgi:hypothetical protein